MFLYVPSAFNKLRRPRWKKRRSTYRKGPDGVDTQLIMLSVTHLDDFLIVPMSVTWICAVKLDVEKKKLNTIESQLRFWWGTFSKASPTLTDVGV